MSVAEIMLVFTTLCTALIAGLFYSFSFAVVRGMQLLDDSEYIKSMQSINKAIQNPIFFTCFFATLLLLPACAYTHYYALPSLRFWLLAAATLVYFTGVFGITLFGNIPLNNTLEKFNLTDATTEAIAAQRVAFEKPWNKLNLVRTLFSAISLILVILACINPG